MLPAQPEGALHPARPANPGVVADVPPSAQMQDHDDQLVGNLKSRASKPVSTQLAFSNSTLQQQDTRQRLAELDNRLGHMSFGNSKVTRVELYDMGAMVDGKKISVKNTNIGQISQTFNDTLQFNSAALETYMRSASPERTDAVLTLLYEIASERSSSAPPVLIEVPTSQTPASAITKLDKLLNKMQFLKAKAEKTPPPMPSWADKVKSTAMSTVGNSMQVYGIYAGVLGLGESLTQGKINEAAIDSASIVAEVGSVLVEKGVEKTGIAMLKNGGKVFNRFAATRVGTKLMKGSGLIGNVLTLPFDIYAAVRSFEAAAKANGKAAQDHYVAAGFSVTSAGLSLLLGGAALAGYGSTAGPIGIAAAAVMIMGTQIYSAVRKVDNIDDYIELSSLERLRSGWFAFLGKKLDDHVTDRYTLAKATSDYSQEIKKESQQLLDGELKQSVETIVNGNFKFELMPVKHWKMQWDADSGELPYKETKEPILKESDDVIDASNDLDESMPGVVVGTKNEGKAVLWQLGAGNDKVIGVQDKLNWFNLGSGEKNITGGAKGNLFQLLTADEPIKETSNAEISKNSGFNLKTEKKSGTGPNGTLRGGDGTDTLSLEGKVDPRGDYAYVGYDINLKEGQLGLRSNLGDEEVAPYMTMTSIENVMTLKGASSRVTGTNDENEIVVRGDDIVDAGAGDDTIVIEGGGTVHGGQGNDTYLIAQGSGSVVIAEDGKEGSNIVFGWNIEGIQSWRIEGNDLIVSSLRGVDGELPGREVRIADVYREENGKRVLQNDKLHFHTLDGYAITPDLPTELVGDQPLTVKAVVLAPDHHKESPQIVSGGEFAVSGDKRSYFIGHDDAEPTIFDVQTIDEAISSTVYLAYDASEIAKVEANYAVTTTKGVSFNYLKYGEASLTITLMNGKKVTFKNFASNRDTLGSNVGGSLMASGFKLNHGFVLTMRDGISYRVETPEHSYFEDHHHPGPKTVDSFGSLKLRGGKYVFSSPYSEKYDSTRKAWTYDMHINEGATVELSPPGNKNETSNATTWNLHVETLGDVGDRDFRFKDGHLWIKNVKVLLSSANVSDNGKAPDVIRVITASGTYQVDVVFELINKEANAAI